MVSRLTPAKPSSASRIKAGLKEFAKDLKADAKEIATDLKKLNGKELLKDVKNGISTFGGEAVGVAGLFGLRYPVSAYEFRVSPGLVRGSRIEDPKGYDKLKQPEFAKQAREYAKQLTSSAPKGDDDDDDGPGHGGKKDPKKDKKKPPGRGDDEGT